MTCRITLHEDLGLQDGSPVFLEFVKCGILIAANPSNSALERFQTGLLLFWRQLRKVLRRQFCKAVDKFLLADSLIPLTHSVSSRHNFSQTAKPSRIGRMVGNRSGDE